MASVVVGWKVCPRQFVFPQPRLLRLKRTVRGVRLWNIKCQMSNIKLTSRTSVHGPCSVPARYSSTDILCCTCALDLLWSLCCFVSDKTFSSWRLWFWPLGTTGQSACTGNWTLTAFLFKRACHPSQSLFVARWSRTQTRQPAATEWCWSTSHVLSMYETYYRLNENVINWIKSFLCYRKQRVKLNGFYSDWAEVLSGIPQGTILGPILFIIYINGLPDLCQHFVEIYLFADDAKLFKHALVKIPVCFSSDGIRCITGMVRLKIKD